LPIAAPAEMPAFVLRNVLTRDECQALTTSIPFSGPGYMGPVDIAKLYCNRVVHRYMAADEALSTLLQQRIHSFLPVTVDHDALASTGLSPQWRFLKYELGGHQGPHTDGREKRVATCESRLTLQLYLNDGGGVDFEGGELHFFSPDLDQIIYKHIPRAGDCLIFYQEDQGGGAREYFLVHEATNVTTGIKYAARTMVEYCTRTP